MSDSPITDREPRSAPAVSVITPCFHAATFLTETLNSLASQKFADWELVVVEDGSDDGTREIVTSFANSVSQSVRYLRHEINQGLPATRNTAIRASHGRWLALLDADDLWAPDHLSASVEVAEKCGADLIVSGSELFDSDTGELLGFREPLPGDLEGLPATLFQTTFFQPSAALLRRSSFEALGFFNPEMRVCEDIELWLRACKAGLKFASTKKRTCRYRKHAAAITGDGGRLAEAKARVCAQFIDYKAVPKSLRLGLTARTFANAGQIFFRKDPGRGSSNYYRAWKLQPWHLGWGLIAIAGKLLALRSSRS